MIKPIIFFYLFIPSLLWSQLDCSMDYKKIEDNFIFYAENKESIPITFSYEIKLKNMSSNAPEKGYFILPPKTDYIELFTLSPEKNKQIGFDFKNASFQQGNLYADIDEDYAYHLPFANGSTYLISQGYDGEFSHHNTFALDFNMKEGTPIHAVRSGLVIEVVDNNKRSCPSEKCKKFNNYVRVMHDDGSFAEYTHIAKDGALVSEGDSIAIDQKIALSGKTGWASGPHLHLVIYKYSNRAIVTLPTIFKINDGSTVAKLKEGVSYTKNYGFSKN